MGESGECPECGTEYTNLWQHLRHYPDHRPSEWSACSECGKRYRSLSHHWTRTECKRPEISKKEMDALTGIIMGDGTLKRDSKNCSIRVEMVTEEYLRHMSNNILPDMSSEVEMHRNSSESASHARSTGFSPEAVPENYQDVYCWRTYSHPKFNTFENWYNDGKKIWPEDIDMSPTLLKHYFVCDGHYDNDNWQRRIDFNVSNERKNKEKVESIFESVGFSISNWNESKRIERGGVTCRIEFDVSTTEEMFKYMGDPLPGFEYKWPEEYR
jgi:hypothetical protein